MGQQRRRTKRVAIACQGGGSHSAFTAGALKRLLEEERNRYEIVALRGTSGGAICALAIFYVVRSGCSWRLLPHDFLPWRSVYHYFREFRLDGTWDRMYAALRERVRVRLERTPASMRVAWIESRKQAIRRYPTKGAPDGPNPAYPAPVFTLVSDQESNGVHAHASRQRESLAVSEVLALTRHFPLALAGRQGQAARRDQYHNAYHNWYHNQPEIHGAL